MQTVKYSTRNRCMSKRKKTYKISAPDSLFEYALSTNKAAFDRFQSFTPVVQNSIRENASGLSYGDLKKYIDRTVASQKS